MNELGEVSGDFGLVLLFIIGGALFVIGGAIFSRILRPNRPNPEKLSTYECGEDPVGNARIQLNNRFYVAALIFLLFDVEIIFLFPWATVFADVELIREAPSWGYFALAEVILFAGILLVGLAYVWAKGDLDWVKPQVSGPKSNSKVPDSEYEAFNRRASQVPPLELVTTEN
ncbi:MAG TPA: NADH-quinone oxidoreductase subunit A [Bacteroidetes bacterium]|nr:NADH-quinone oxidoreductase subunit A [Bacteroidota bacterium]